MRIGDKYELIEEIGRGGQAITWRGRTDDGQQVFVKELRLAHVASWKNLELFEREIATLRQLQHPGIPKYIDDLVEDDGASRSYFLVQEFVPGRTLGELVDENLINDNNVQGLFDRVLQIVSYLHRHTPPVIHRDIKPENIIVDDDWNPSLVDFGAVQIVIPKDVGGSTIVGTTGFMAPEQLVGKSEPASDLYALGATFAFVLTQTNPADMETERMKLRWRANRSISVTERTLNAIDSMLEPHIEDRPTSAREALASVSKKRQRESVSASTALARAAVQEASEPKSGRGTLELTSEGVELTFLPNSSREIGLLQLLTIALITMIIGLWAGGGIWVVLAVSVFSLLVALDNDRKGFSGSQTVFDSEGFSISSHLTDRTKVSERGGLAEYVELCRAPSDRRGLYVRTTVGLVLLHPSVSDSEMRWLAWRIDQYLRQTPLNSA